MQFITGIVMFLFGLWILKKSANKSDSNTKFERDIVVGRTMNKDRAINTDGNNRVEPNLLEAKDLERTINRELTEKVALDAMHREHRAKMALIAVLKQQGCSQEQILEVLQSIDEPEKTAFPGTTT